MKVAVGQGQKLGRISKKVRDHRVPELGHFEDTPVTGPSTPKPGPSQMGTVQPAEPLVTGRYNF